MHPASSAFLVALLVRSAASQISGVASGDTVFLKSHTGHHLDVESEVARARWNSRSVWQSLVIEKIGGGIVQHGDTIFLKTHRGLYLHVKHVDVQASWTEKGTWQGFVVEKAGGGTIDGTIYPGDTICLLAHTGHRIDVQGKIVQARWRECGAWQSFQLQKDVPGAVASGATVFLTTHLGFQVEVEDVAVRSRWQDHGLMQQFLIESKVGSTLYAGDGVFLKSHTGHYVDVDGEVVRARYPDQGNLQQLFIEKGEPEPEPEPQQAGPIFPGCHVFLKSQSGNYIDVQGDSEGQLRARWAHKGSWQGFMLEIKSTAPMTTSTRRFLSSTTTASTTTNTTTTPTRATTTATITTITTTTTTSTTATTTTTSTTTTTTTAITTSTNVTSPTTTTSTDVTTTTTMTTDNGSCLKSRGHGQLLHVLTEDGNSSCAKFSMQGQQFRSVDVSGSCLDWFAYRGWGLWDCNGQGNQQLESISSGKWCYYENCIIVSGDASATVTIVTTDRTACRTAVNGDPCFRAVLWAMSTGVKTHPEWYKGLTQWSSFQQFQQVLHEIRVDNGVCPEPCRDDFDYELVWEDNFDGDTVNTTNWIVGSLRDPLSGHLVPGAVGDHLLNWGYQGYITEEDTYVEDGKLVLRNQRRSYKGSSPDGWFKFTTGHVMSMHRVFLNKGYVEFRAKFPHGPKLWPALWLVAEDLVWGPEWDLWEYFGWKDNRVGYDAMGMHLFESSPWPNIKIHDGWIKAYNSNYNCSAWHVYGWEWTDAAATWWIDGHLVYKLARSPSMRWPDKDVYLILNNGVKTNSPDADTAWPNYLTIDYVKVYKKK